jgi:hypothetical protein
MRRLNASSGIKFTRIIATGAPSRVVKVQVRANHHDPTPWNVLYGYASSSTHSKGGPPPLLAGYLPFAAPARPGPDRNKCSRAHAPANEFGQRLQRRRITSLPPGYRHAPFAFFCRTTADPNASGQSRGRARSAKIRALHSRSKRAGRYTGNSCANRGIERAGSVGSTKSILHYTHQQQTGIEHIA